VVIDAQLGVDDIAAMVWGTMVHRLLEPPTMDLHGAAGYGEGP
jgi:hypothetical protein